MDVMLRSRLEARGVDVARGIKAHMDNEDMYERIFRLVMSDPNFERLFDMADSGSAEELFEITHSMKGTLGNIGIDELYEYVLDICETTRAGRLDRVTGNIANIKQIYYSFKDILAE